MHLVFVYVLLQLSMIALMSGPQWFNFKIDFIKEIAESFRRVDCTNIRGSTLDFEDWSWLEPHYCSTVKADKLRLTS